MSKELLDKKAKELGWNSFEESYNKLSYIPLIDIVERAFQGIEQPELSKRFIKKKILEGFQEFEMELIRPDRVSVTSGLNQLFKYLEHKRIKLNIK